MAKFLFIVQGEGRGHLTQAISLYEILSRNGHQVVATMVGVTKNRKIPSFYKEAIAAPTVGFESPSLIYGKGKAPNLLLTLGSQLIKAKQYFKNADLVHATVLQYQPDLIVNFYEMAAGFYNFFYRPHIPTVSIGHQYLLLHKQFQSISGKKLDRVLLNLNTRLTAIGTSRKLALSFYPMPGYPAENMHVTPPLIRSIVKEQFVEKNNYLLAYVTHAKIAEDLQKWQAKNSHETIHCFVDKKGLKKSKQTASNFFLHPIDPEHYLDKMAKCKGLVTTAGFESVCEAMYLGKPVMMVPVKKHIEQRINAHDGQRAGAGIYSKHFKVNKLLSYLPKHQDVSDTFEAWEASAEQVFLQNFEEVLAVAQPQPALLQLPKPDYSLFKLLKGLILGQMRLAPK